jgi:serine/threonine-protein kinase
MADDLDNPSSPRLEAAIAEYLEALERGQAVDRDDLLGRYDDVAPDLQQFFVDHERMARLASPIREGHVRSLAARLLPPAAETPGTVDGNARTIGLDSSSFALREGVRHAAGLRIGEYEVIEELGRGGMGVVYKARHTRLNRVVALKMVLAGQFAAQDDLDRFHAEARAAAALEHAGIVPIFEIGDCQGQPYFSMALVEGRSLAQHLESGPLPSHFAARLLRKIVAAVAYAHAHGVIHRDLKPGNILLAIGDDLDACEPKITDFGLAKREGADSRLTASGQILGTPGYMPPEQAAGRLREIGPASDVYSLGAILYAMLTGRPPFSSENPVEVILQVLESEPTLPHVLRPDVPRELEWICLKCLEKNPADRYATADDLAADLDRFLRREPPEARALNFMQRSRRWMRRQPVLAWHLIGLGTLLTATQLIFIAHQARAVAYHVQVSSVLVLWMVACVAFQWLLNRRAAASWSHYFWSAADAAFLTALLALIAPPLGPLLAGYVVLICASGLFFQTRLVAFTTASVILAFACLMFLRPEETRPLHYALLFETALAITGFVAGYQVWRMGVLREYYEERKG